MLKNKGKKLAVLSLLCILGLTGCNEAAEEIYAKPSNYEDQIVVIKDDEGNDVEVHKNVMKIIYDAIHEGSLASDVLDKALYNYAESVFGSYNCLTRSAGNTEITLKEAVKTWNGGLGSAEEINEFIVKHKAYWTRNDAKEHINDDDPDNPIVIEEDAEFTPCDSERQAVVSKWENIEDRIAENMYNRALGGSYTEKHLFKEIKYVRALHEQSEKVNYQSALESTTLKPLFVPYTVEKKDVFTALVDGVHILNREYYQTSASYDEDIGDTIKARFIEDNVIPEIYNDLLVEQYLLEESEQSIRTSTARKINVIKIEKYASHSYNADMLVKDLVKTIYGDLPASSVEHIRTDAEEIEEYGKDLFELYSTVAKGLYDEIAVDDDAKAIVSRLNSAASDVYQEKSYKYLEGTADEVEFKYYENTTYGDTIKEFEKLNKGDTWDEVDKTLLSKYTSNGTVPVEEGLEQEVLNIKQQENITKGWFIKSKSPSLDSNGTINDRLFKLSVANAKIEIGDDIEEEISASNLAELESLDRFVKDGGNWKVRDERPEDENSFLCSINGAFFLKFEGQYAGDDWKNDIVYDDGSAYYIVQVLEAAKDSKLRNQSDSRFGSYAVTRGNAFLNETIDEIATILGETGNFASVSKNHWLEKMDFKYHDQKVYDYFKENYPDLFK